jgi:hypothetical protein
MTVWGASRVAADIGVPVLFRLRKLDRQMSI